MQLHDLSFDPRDPFQPVPGPSGVRWAVQVFTLGNVYGVPDTAATIVDQPGSMVRVQATQLSWGGGQFSSPGHIDAAVTETDGVLSWRISARHNEPIKSIKLLLRGLPEAAMRAGWWHATTDASSSHTASPGAPVQFDYPNPAEWQTPWVAAGVEDLVTLSVRDVAVHATRFFAHTPPWAGGETVVELICEADAQQFGASFATPELRARPSADRAAVEADFEEHLQHVQTTYGLRSWTDRTDVPAWARSIRMVVNLHGQHWTGKVFNTFDDMAQILSTLSEHIPGEQVLAYLPGWEGRYYWQYPYFSPAPTLGGPAGFGRLADTAKRLGVRLMPMFGAHGANAQLYPEWTEATFLNPTGRYAVLLNKPDWDGDRSGEDDQVFLNTGHPGFRSLLVDQVSEMVDRYGIDAAYFDTTGAWFNDPRHNLYDGYLDLKAELAKRHPTLMIAGEAWTDALLAVFPMNLSWLGSSTETHFPQLLSRHGRAVQHLLEGAPGGSTGVYEGGYAPADRRPTAEGHLPSISFVGDTLSAHADEVLQFCRTVLSGALQVHESRPTP